MFPEPLLAVRPFVTIAAEARIERRMSEETDPAIAAVVASTIHALSLCKDMNVFREVKRMSNGVLLIPRDRFVGHGASVTFGTKTFVSSIASMIGHV